MAWLQWDLLGAAGAALLALYLAVAAFVLFSAPGRPANRWLAPLIVFEAFPGQGGLAALLFTDPGMEYAMAAGVGEPTGAALMVLLPGFLGIALETPLVYPFRRRLVRWFLIGAAILVAAVLILTPGVGTYNAVLYPYSILVLAFSLVAAIDSYRRTPPKTLVRKRARAYLLAFGTRDLAVIWAISRLIYSADEYPPLWADLLWITLSLLYLGFLTYGILKTQLFDIDVKLRWTIHKGTVAAVFAAVFIVVAQLAENALNQRLGWAWGGLAAGVLLLGLSPILRFAETVSRKAVPTAKPLEDLTRDERAEFYADHVRAAWEDGSIDRSDRALLNTLRGKLGLSPDVAARLELDVTSST